MFDTSRLVVGMPAGSLADPKRGGNLIQFLESAGFKTKGYDSGGPTQFVHQNYMFGWDGRPQEFGAQLSISELDVAIAGDDWIRERSLEMRLEYGISIELEKVLPLRRGGVRIVGITVPGDGDDTWQSVLKKSADKKQLITVVSEMPYLAVDWLRKRYAELGMEDLTEKFSVQKYKTPPRIDRGIVVYETWGKTEAKVKNGGADLGVEITQSGSAIRNYGLSIIDTIMESETGIWINPEIRQNPEKLELLRMFLLNMYGTIHAENKVMLLFNVKNDKLSAIEDYLEKNNLFGDEPTSNPGPHYTEYSIQLDTTDNTNPLAEVRYRLAALGARSIETIPLTSSIPDIDCIGI